MRLSILRAFEGQSIQRQPTRMWLRHQGQTHDAWLLVTATPLTDRQVNPWRPAASVLAVQIL